MKLKDKRVLLDEIDKEIATLLNKRFNIINEIKQIKKQEKIQILDPKREQEIITNNKKYLKTQYHDNFEKVYKVILEVSKDQQKDE